MLRPRATSGVAPSHHGSQSQGRKLANNRMLLHVGSMLDSKASVCSSISLFKCHVGATILALDLTQVLGEQVSRAVFPAGFEEGQRVVAHTLLNP